MHQRAVENLKKWFRRYAESFKDGSPQRRENIELKEQHTYRVVGEALAIARDLGLDDDALRRIEVMALLHDIGRFEQYARYGTFVDRNSENHASLGVRIVEAQGILDGFDDHSREVILRGILYHNRPEPPKAESAECLLYTKILRDADKLDIYRVVTSYYLQKDARSNPALELELPDTPGISEAVYRDFQEGRVIPFAHLGNLNDFKVLQVAWVFDLNFAESARRVRECGYLDRIREALPAGDRRIDGVFAIARAELRRRCEGRSSEVLESRT